MRALRPSSLALLFVVCLSGTIVDGIVLARSHFHSSANYRSVVLHGDAELLVSPADHAAALRCVAECTVGESRWETGRQPNEVENKVQSNAVCVMSIIQQHNAALATHTRTFLRRLPVAAHSFVCVCVHVPSSVVALSRCVAFSRCAEH